MSVFKSIWFLLALGSAAGAFQHAEASTTRRWTTLGYGYLIELEADELRVFEHRRLGDLPVLTATRNSPSQRDAGQVFTADGYDPITLRNAELAEGARIEWGLTSHALALEVTTATPRAPAEELRNDPVLNFEWFCASFAEHYAFFELHGVDWEAATARARASIGAQTTGEELLDVFSDLLGSLDDVHCSVQGLGRWAGASGEDPDPMGSRRQGDCRTLIDTQYLIDKPTRACQDQLTFGRLTDSVGYLRMDAMEGLALSPDPEDGARALGLALDQAFEELAGIEGLVVDVRFNGGGFDIFGFKLTERLINERTLAVRKEVRANATDPTAIAFVGNYTIEPSDRPGFRGPLALLVSRHTASAAEVFGMSLVNRSRTTFIGEPSAGGFSDIHFSHLPNGWTVGLSNELYLTAAGACFEGVGLPLDLELATVRSADLDAGVDPGLEAAVEAVLD